MNPQYLSALRLRSWLVYSQKALAPWQQGNRDGPAFGAQLDPLDPLETLELSFAELLTWNSIVRCCSVQLCLDFAEIDNW